MAENTFPRTHGAVTGRARSPLPALGSRGTGGRAPFHSRRPQQNASIRRGRRYGFMSHADMLASFTMNCWSQERPMRATTLSLAAAPSGVLATK